MTEPAIGHPNRIDQFFAGPGARGDRWRSVVEAAEAWSSGSGSRAGFDAAFGETAAIEEFHAYPGSQLIAALRDHVAENDAPSTAALARRITRGILNRSYRQNPGDWEAHEEDETVAADVLPPALGRADAHRPYFEILDRHRCARGALARACRRVAPAAPAARCVRLRAGLCRQLRGCVLRERC